MKTEEIRLKIEEALNNVGVFLSPEELEGNNIGDLISDSLTYISFIIELEDIFGIELPDEFLSPDKITSLDSLALSIQELML